MTLPSIARCDHCRGPALWTLDAFGDPWYICEKQCDGFMQMEMWHEEPIWETGVVDYSERDAPDGPTEENALPF